jgi:hypothetical protein
MKDYKLVHLILLLLIFTLGISVAAQTPVKVQKAELSIPFGVVKGKLIAVGETLVFVDEETPDASFAIEKSSIRTMTELDGVITIDTSRPIKDRSGERSRLALRLTEGNGAALMAWHATNGVSGAKSSAEPVAIKIAAATAPAPADLSGTKVYQARQTRFPFGSTDGKLVISETEIAFEGLDDIKRSQRWSYQDIKEIKQTSTYLIEIVPFRGDKYKLELQGEGLSSAQFKALTDRLAAARTTK